MVFKEGGSYGNTRMDGEEEGKRGGFEKKMVEQDGKWNTGRERKKSLPPNI